MSTDRELLEFAAKCFAPGPIVCYESKRNLMRLGVRGAYFLWNPKQNSDDSINLSANAGINLEFGEVRVFAFIPDSVGVGQRCSEFYRDHDNDKAKATRYAILRAAAEIGRAMP